MSEETSEFQCANVAPALFKDNLLIIVGFSCWGGTMTVKDGDEAIFGSNNFDKKFFKKGSVVLIHKDHLKPFEDERGRLSAWLTAMGKTFLVPSMRLFKKTQAKDVFAKVRECRAKFDQLSIEFLEKYDSLVQERTEAFDLAHPEHRGRLNAYFPTADKLSSAFGVRCVPISISDVDGMESICSEEKDAFRLHIRSAVGDIARDFREMVVKSITKFKEGVTKARESDSGEVNSRTVKAFRDFLERIENNDFLGDHQVTDLIRQVQLGVNATENWNVRSNTSVSEAILPQLEAIITAAQDEVSEAAVITSLGAPMEEVVDDDFSADLGTGLDATITEEVEG